MPAGRDRRRERRSARRARLDGLPTLERPGGRLRAPRRDRLGRVPADDRKGGRREPARRHRLDRIPPRGGKAADANLLDGLDSTELVRACRTGAVHAIGLIRGASTFSATFVDVPESFTCWRGSGKVAARRLGTGRYELILSGAPFNTFCLSAPLLVGAIQNDASDNNFFTYSSVPCWGVLETRIEVTNTSSGGTLQDGLISFAWYRILG